MEFFPRVAVGRMRNVETVESVLKELNRGILDAAGLIY